MSWTKNEAYAQCNLGTWTARVDLRDQPSLSLFEDQTKPPVKVLFVPQEALQPASRHQPHSHDSHLQLGDSYVRQSDLVTIFPEHEPFRFGYQVYFCVKPSLPNTMLVELWLSVQTSTLESHPQIKLVMEGCSLMAESRSLYRSHDKTCGLLVHPLDALDCSPVTESRPGSAFLVFGRFMEKGVIRRMRCQVVVSSVGLSSADWEQLLDSFSQSPLPLTA
jgi:hypothetical protein